MGQALYHDGACTCATLANLTQKVGLPGRETFVCRGIYENWNICDRYFQITDNFCLDIHCVRVFNDGFSRKDSGNRNREQLVPSVLTNLRSGVKYLTNVCVMYVMMYEVCAGRTDR